MRINPRWLIAGHLLAGCGTSSEDSSMVEELDRIDSTAETFVIQTPVFVSEYERTEWTITAVDSSGLLAESYSGEVSVAATPGYASVVAVAVENGVGVQEAYLGVPGEARLEVSDGAISGQSNVTVGPPAWERNSSQWVLSGVVDQAQHWTYGGIWGGAVATTDSEWIGLFLTTAGQGLESDQERVVSRWVSTDQGETWTLSPDTPVLSDVQAIGLVAGTWEMFSLNEATRTIHRWTSSDQGVSWEMDGCSFTLANNGWSQGGVSDLSVIALGEETYRFYYTGWLDTASPRGGIGQMDGVCNQEPGNYRLALSAGNSNEWNSFSMSSPFVWREQGKWKLLATGTSAQNDAPSVGYWWSSDGETWSAVEENPQLSKGIEAGSWDARGIDYPFVVATKGPPLVFASGIPQDWRPRLVRFSSP